MARRNRTNTDDVALSEQQLTAIDCIVTGKNLQDTADAIGCARPTVSQWVNHHAGFQAALNRRRQELWGELTQTLQGLLPKALEVLRGELDGEQRLPAAVHVLKACGLYGMVLPPGPTEAEAIVQAQRQRTLERTQSAITADDIRVAAARREEERGLAELALS